MSAPRRRLVQRTMQPLPSDSSAKSSTTRLTPALPGDGRSGWPQRRAARLARRQKRYERLAPGISGQPSLFLAAERAALDEATVKAAHKFHVDALDLAVAAAGLWGRSLTEQRDLEVSRQVAPGNDGLVFTGPSGGPLYRGRLSDHWRPACRAVGAPAGLHIHDLRHHAATLTARMPGITTKELMARIGHSSPRAALIYQHATEERDPAAADFLDEQIAAVERPERAKVCPSATEPRPPARWPARSKKGAGRKTARQQGEHSEAAGGIEPPYGALQAPA
jgi:hypothetical protein